MSAHTPGPWDAQGFVVVTLDADKVVTIVDYIKKPKDEGLANARLIAAAPDMLAALRWVALVVKHKSFCPKAEQRGDCDCGLRHVENAIAKAEGR